MPSISRIAKTFLNSLRATHVDDALLVLGLAAAAVLVAGCGVAPVAQTPHSLSLQGTVHGGQQPVSGAVLQLYAAGAAGDATAATPLISATLTTSDGTGSAVGGNAGNLNNSLPLGAFSITGAYTCPSVESQVYLVATGGNPGLAPGMSNPSLAMMAMLGRCGDLSASSNVFIDELTTVGSIAPLEPYMNSYASLGSGTGDLAQFLAAIALVRQYADTSHGSVPGPDLAPGYYASSLEVQTLGDILAGCVNSAGGAPCAQLFALTTPPGGVAPTDTIGAALNIIRYPNNNAAAIFGLLAPGAPFQPTLTAAPSSWALSIKPMVATPVITPAGGTFSASPTVTITTTTPGVTIYYTTDGSVPTTSSSMYSGGFTLSGSATVKAIATAAGFAASAVASAQFTLPVAGAATQLIFVTQPGSPAVNGAIGGVRVGVADAYGNLVPVSGVTLTVALGANPGNGTLSGTKTATTSKDGSITFSGLALNSPGVGYTLTVSSTLYGAVTSAPFTIYASALAITQPLQTIGVGRVTYGTVSLVAAAPAGGVLVALTMTDPSITTVTPTSVLIPAGQTSASYTVTGVGAGNTVLTASAAGYANATWSEIGNIDYVAISNVPASLAVNATAQVTIALTAPAPVGGLVVNILTSNAAAVTASPNQITFSAGSTFSVTTLTGRGFGSAYITTQPTFGNFGGESKIIGGLTNSATLTSTLSLTKGQSGVTDTLTLSSPAPAGGLTFALSSDVVQVATVPSTVTVAAGATTASFAVTGVGVGTANIKASFSGLPDATTAVTVTGSIGLAVTQIPKRTLGQMPVLLSSTPALPITITVTSDNPAVLTLSKDTATVGTASITYTNVTNPPTFYGHGIGVGTANVTISGTNYGSATVSASVNDTTVAILTAPTANAIVGGSPVSVSVGLVQINSITGLVSGSCVGCPMLPGLSISIPVNSSNTAVGTISTNPVILSGFASTTTNFVPVGPGTANIVLTQPSGFPSPNNSFLSATETVTAPTFVPLYTSDTVGTGIYIPKTATLSQNFSGGVAVTVTSNNPAVAVVSSNSAIGGSASVVFNGVTFTIPTVYVQGLSVGTTTLTYSSPSFASVNTTVTVLPGGYVFTTPPTIGLKSVAGPATFGVTLAILNSAGTAVSQLCNNGFGTIYCYLNPMTSNQFTVSSSNPAAATASSPNTVSRTTGLGSYTIQPVDVGTTTISLGAQPTPMVMISNATYTQGTVTVTMATMSATSVSIGASLYTSATVTLGAAPASFATITLTSSNPSVAVISNYTSVAGGASITIPNVSTANAQTYYVQGLSPGTSTVTLSAPGFTGTSATITVTPTGIVTTTPTLTSNAFAASASMSLVLAQLNPSTFAVASYCTSTSCLPNPGTQYSIAVTSSNPTAATLSVSPVVFAAGAVTATALAIPHDIGVTTLSLGAQPAGLITTSTTGSLATTYTVTGDTFAFSSSPLQLGAGVYISDTVLLPSVPSRPVTVTVSLADPTLGVLTTNPAVMGTSSTLSFPNMNGSQQQVFYIQGIAPGRTRLVFSAPGYNSGFQPIVVNRVGITTGLNLSNHLDLQISTGTALSTGAIMSLLDPYSLSWLADCLTTSCLPNPGQSTATTFVSDDPSIAVFTTTPNSLDPATGLISTITVTPVAAGFANYTIVQPPGFYNTTTKARNGGRISVNNVLNMVSHDVDTGVGVEVPSSYTLSGTTINILSLIGTATIADPTVAVLSTSPSVAGSASISYGSVNNLGPTFYVQGLKEGTTTITFAADLYVSRVVTVKVHKAGFVTHQQDFVSSLGSHSFNIPIVPAVLDDSLQWFQDAEVNPGHTGSTVAVSTSNAAVATITTSPVAFGALATTANANLHYVTAGTVTTTLGAPSSGYSVPTTYQSVTATIQ